MTALLRRHAAGGRADESFALAGWLRDGPEFVSHVLARRCEPDHSRAHQQSGIGCTSFSASIPLCGVVFDHEDGNDAFVGSAGASVCLFDVCACVCGECAEAGLLIGDGERAQPADMAAFGLQFCCDGGDTFGERGDVGCLESRDVAFDKEGVTARHWGKLCVSPVARASRKTLLFVLGR